MAKAIVYMRFKQLLRVLRSLTLFHTLVLAGIVVFALLYFYNEVKKSPSCFYAIAAPAILLLSVHLSRKDKAFILSPFRSVNSHITKRKSFPQSARKWLISAELDFEYKKAARRLLFQRS